ncbi:FAD-dependent oxidoreductase, partial [Dehalococcoidia bacterium]|nr:FAD-dependent oxidoreductase [Dehalococcoidia bacterium]
VSIQTSTTVLGFEEEKGNLTGVKTTSGTLKADNIVLAAGSWSPKIVETLDLNLPIQPAKGYSLTFERTKESPPLPLLFTERKVFMTPMGNKLRIGGTLELAGMNLAINQRRVDAILSATSQYLPTVDLGSLADAEVWSGLRPATPDGLPLVGRTRRYPNLVVAAGHAMIGMSTGPATGLLVSQMVLEEKPFISAKPLDPARFN